MSTHAYDIEELTALRRDIHMNPEPAFEEYNTQKRIRDFITSKGIPESRIKTAAKTGLIVDIEGKGPGITGPHKIIAFRADIDALRLQEANPTLQYRSINNCAHSCCHDGHIICLLGGFAKLIDNLYYLPENRTARFLFQPAEEGFMGAKFMIEDGCLTDVEEIWGLHASVLNPPNAVQVRYGVINAGTITFNIAYIGQGGHSSLRTKLKDPVLPLCDLNLRIEKMLRAEYENSNDELFTLCCPRIETSSASNVICSKAVLGGKLRYLDEKIGRQVFARVKELAEIVATEYGVDLRLDIQSDYPSIENDDTLVKQLFNIRPDVKEFPHVMLSSDDFSLYAKNVKACYVRYFIGEQEGRTLHTPGIDFNDECIDGAASYWFDVMKDRLDMKRSTQAK